MAVIVPNQGRSKPPSLLESPSSQPANMLPAGYLPLHPHQAQEDIIHLAWRHDIPVWAVRSLCHSQTWALLTRLQPDLICVACFPYLFPKPLLTLPNQGCLNLHPSLLPAYRGPDPIYWILRNKEQRSGVTLHFLDEGVDSGDIVSQVAFELGQGMTEAELTQRCAEEGAKLLVAAVQALEQGGLPRRPQPSEGRSYYPSRGKM